MLKPNKWTRRREWIREGGKVNCVYIYAWPIKLEERKLQRCEYSKSTDCGANLCKDGLNAHIDVKMIFQGWAEHIKHAYVFIIIVYTVVLLSPSLPKSTFGWRWWSVNAEFLFFTHSSWQQKKFSFLLTRRTIRAQFTCLINCNGVNIWNCWFVVLGVFLVSRR